MTRADHIASAGATGATGVALFYSTCGLCVTGRTLKA